ncbi:Exochitinase 1 [Streptomyces sp. V17-9]|nr:Exochitinase 1 [Streptomyces sp. V17-9]
MERARVQRARPLVRRPLVTVLTAAALAASGTTALTSAARAADADLARNGGFESALDGWTCTAGTTVTSPVHSGTAALKATPAGADNARCSQTVSVKPDSQYTLSGYVRGTYVYLGASGTGTTDVSTWAQSAPDWQQLRPPSAPAPRPPRSPSTPTAGTAPAPTTPTTSPSPAPAARRSSPRRSPAV